LVGCSSQVASWLWEVRITRIAAGRPPRTHPVSSVGTSTLANGILVVWGVPDTTLQIAKYQVWRTVDGDAGTLARIDGHNLTTDKPRQFMD